MEEYDVVFISETLFKDNSCPSFEEYTLHRRGRSGVRNGGGVCIYIKIILVIIPTV